MENIKVEAQDGKLIITVTPGAPVPSASGKTMVVASTRGASPVTKKTRFDADKILRDNPQIDSKKLQAFMELYEKLRALGVKPHGFQLAPMGGGQRVAMKERKDDDAAAGLDALDCSGSGVIR